MPLSVIRRILMSLGVVSGGFALGIQASRRLVDDEQMLMLTGLTTASVCAVLYLVVHIERQRAEARRQLARTAAVSPRLTERIDAIERMLTDVATQLRYNGSQKTVELTTEVAMLRSMVEKLARNKSTQKELPKEAQTGTPEASAEPALPPVDMQAVIQSALQESRVDLYLQPIVQLPDRKVAHYEGFSRMRDLRGKVIFPEEYLEEAERAGLMSAIDNLLLFRCINLVRKLGPRRPGVRLFVNLSEAALGDQRFLAELVQFIRAHRELAGRMVLEVAAADVKQITPASWEQLAILGRLGFGFSIDQVTDLAALDPARLASANVQFVKIDAKLLLEGPCPIDRATFCTVFHRHQINLIATHVEDEATAARVQDLGLRFGQGFLFGSPKPSRADIDAPAKRVA